MKKTPRRDIEPVLGAIALFVLVCLGLMAWTHLRWSATLEHTTAPLDTLNQVRQKVLAAELNGERLLARDPTVTTEMVLADLATAEVRSRQLLTQIDETRGDIDGQDGSDLRDAAERYSASLMQLRSAAQARIAASADDREGAAVALRVARAPLDLAAMALERQLRLHSQVRIDHQRWLTLFTLGLLSALAITLMGVLMRLSRQRNESDAALAASEAHLRTFMRAMPDVSFLFDRDGRYLDVFGPAEKLAEPVERMLGRRIADVHGERHVELFMSVIRLALETREPQRCEFALEVQQGTRWFEARVCAVPDREQVVWVSWDISERRAAELRVTELTRLYSFISQVNQAFVWTRSEAELFDRICNVAISHGHLRLAWVVQRDGAASAPRVAVQRGDSTLVHLCAASLPPATHSHAMAVSQSLLTGTVQWRPGSVKPAGEAPLDLVSVPVRNLNQVVAAVVLVGNKLDPEDREQQALIAELGSDMSHALAQFTREAQWQESLARTRLHAAALESTQDGVMVTDLRPRIVSVNRAFTEITGYSETEAVGMSPRLLQSGRHEPAFFTRLWNQLLTHGRWQGEVQNRRKNGELYTQWMSVSTVRDEHDQPTHYVSVFTDITPQKEAEQRLQHLAHFDPLTQLPNRLMVLSRLEHAIASAARAERRVAVLFIDLDNFKTVNDSLGHSAGDDLLRAVADRLGTRTRREDTLGRLGGDEFILMLEHLREPQDAAQVAQELIGLLETPFRVAGQEVYVQASIGISLYPDDGLEVGELVRDADAAMYQAKRAGRGVYRFYTESLTTAAQSRLALDTRLRRALENKEFVLWYQPLYRLADRCLIGLEALVRLNQPGLPPIGPAEFIPLLEETGQITTLGAWVTQEACRQGRAWLDEGLDFGRIAINLSPQEIRRGQTDERVREALERSGLPAERLELELTESGLMEQGERAEAFLHRLRALGVRLAIDDFGTGYSSLAYLKRFPVSKLKIDRSFVRDLPADANDAQLVQTMVSMGRNLGISVLAEGVETEAQFDYLRSLGCDAAQGYFFSPPRPADEARHWLRPLAAAQATPVQAEPP
ncbi:diguanylate cyclase/phosphodiesterase with PAS/PAC sensor(s) [Leptothrix cholodnii SP-6]|uniref:Diguanylate cyclase/phosphodiesterase with PAS/PAC sensor(S) n=1 Tax=Leptothrix cholodnii (strain ATCC 51168 / LMG 8142 / SP-6) TaxID=395495 RepID=B1Y791_LEPCP|nr:EAL domain-containing protein [Leptothrix cholodnii]ACB34846.1 diguanylate cyclase/phosphodiesterase with PAS/PAC sensor(s) [Leptothrix cholodnii SP-6]